MYNLSPRWRYRNESGTPANIGPSTYLLFDDSLVCENYVPFLTSAPRKIDFGSGYATSAIYDPKKPTKRVTGGVSLRYTAPRFKETKVEELPPPNAYLPKSTIDSYADKAERVETEKKKRHIRDYKLYVCRVPFSVGYSAPTTPDKYDFNGYDIDSGGNLIKIPPDDDDATQQGPPFYDISKSGPCQSWKLYKGGAWSKSTSKRSSLLINDHPGPGAYNLDTPRKFNVCAERIREMARKASYLPRFAEVFEDRARRERLPGPNEYMPGDLKKMYDERNKSCMPRPFIISQPRFAKVVRDDLPGPADYPVCLCYRDRKDYAVANAPFNTSGVRKDMATGEGPGPAAYSVKRAFDKGQDKNYCFCCLPEAPFLNTAQRDISFAKKDGKITPGPASYNTVPKSETECVCDCRQSVFKSKTGRFEIVSSGGAEPASYDVTPSFRKLHAKCNPGGKAPFYTSAAKFNKTYDSFTMPIDSSHPGPAYYAPELPRNEKSHYFNLSPRFATVDQGVPGPGTYTCHPAVGNSIYKAMHTHNLRLAKNVVRYEDVKERNQKRIDYNKKLRMHRKLKWFQKGRDNYKHCECPHTIYDF